MAFSAMMAMVRNKSSWFTEHGGLKKKELLDSV